MKMKYILCSILAVAFSCGLHAQTKISDEPALHDGFNFIIATDLGRNGYFDQKPIAELMGETAWAVNAEFVVASGDTHHYMGVQSTTDPLWMTNFELIYKHPELQIPWYPVLGNHEYRGNTQAVLDYAKVSRRWCMADRYYTQSYKLGNGESLRIVYIDTPPLIDKYRNDSKGYPDAVKQDMDKQLAWLDATLKASTETWKIVIGHHPIYAYTEKADVERLDMQKRVDPILRKYNVDMYICGHLHTFQHLKVKGSDIDYVVNTSGSLSRKPKAIEGTVFCSPESGFSVFSATPKAITLYMVNNKGEVIHQVKRSK
ncbi:MAG: acid phosphatase [Bacteroidales bacterium 45-6]|nr:MAG: acid phosphatase [Bacteroidales bacterium 45-6]